MYKINTNYVEQKMNENEIVLVLLPKGTYYLIKGTGVDIWNELKRGKDREQIINLLMDNYDASEDAISKSFDKFIKSLIEENIVIE